LTSLVVDPQEQQQQGTTKSTIYVPFTDFQANGKYLDNESFITFTTQHNICLDSARSNYFLFFFKKHNGRPYLTKLLAPASQAHWQRAGESYTALHWVWTQDLFWGPGHHRMGYINESFLEDTLILLCSCERAHCHTWCNLEFFCLHC